RISSKEGDKAVYMTRLRLLRRRIGQAVLMRAFGSADKAISKLLDRAGFTKRARASMAFL
ncbi:60S ribosomal export protein nmd3, partial [Aduncisulcus paluster]